ncbi:uncharacterized protein [Panulirus ornatus]|uniref:uncharacterized protein n=1 Tax=Panulirus ornatus TaxID=150431 RepID=UPI003A891B24
MSSLLRALFNGTSKHKKLSEEWATIREPVVEGVTFYCKYLGSTLVDDPKGEASTAEAIKRIIHAAKQVARKPERVSLHVSLQGIRMAEVTSSQVLLQTSIYKISYCSADAHYDHVFAFIATNDNDTCECHAFLCPKRKMAQAVTISIAQAFNLAYEYWKMSMENKQNGEIYAQEELPAEVKVSSAMVHNSSRSNHSQPSSRTSSPIPIRSDFGSSDMSTSGYQSSTQALLIDLEDSSDVAEESSKIQLQSKTSVLSKPWDAFDDFSDISDGFSRLALRREHHPQRLPGTSPMGWGDIDLAAFTDHPPASPTGSGSWPSASSPSPSSPTASSPTNPWSLGQSPPDVWEEYSKSPNMAFLHSCQSPPLQSVISSFSQPSTRLKNDSFTPSQKVKDPFIPCVIVKDSLVQSETVKDQFAPGETMKYHTVESETAKDPFKPCETVKDPFLSCKTTNDPFVSCGTLKDPFVPSKTVKDPFFPTEIEKDSFTSDHNSRDLFAHAHFTHDPLSPTQPEKSRDTLSSSSPACVCGCGSGQPAWSGDLLDGRKGNNVIYF